MKTLKVLLALLLCILSNSYSQSLATERIAKIKSSTVKITLNDQLLGTGFFIDGKGTVLTCWHVIEPCLYEKADKTLGTKALLIEYSNGKKDSVCIPTLFLSRMLNEAVAYDFCILIPNKALPKTSSTPFLKMGAFSDVNEGDEIYTCGYPLGIPIQFVSKGIVSTKFTDNTNPINRAGGPIYKSRDVALLDLTLNRGNSGGAIVKVGKTMDEDLVIGIADFIITPMGTKGDDMVKDLDSRSGGAKINGVDPNATMTKLAYFISRASNGISGCVSIDHFTKIREKW